LPAERHDGDAVAERQLKAFKRVGDSIDDLVGRGFRVAADDLAEPFLVDAAALELNVEQTIAVEDDRIAGWTSIWRFWKTTSLKDPGHRASRPYRFDGARLR